MERTDEVQLSLLYSLAGEVKQTHMLASGTQSTLDSRPYGVVEPLLPYLPEDLALPISGQCPYAETKSVCIF